MQAQVFILSLPLSLQGVSVSPITTQSISSWWRPWIPRQLRSRASNAAFDASIRTAMLSASAMPCSGRPIKKPRTLLPGTGIEEKGHRQTYVLAVMSVFVLSSSHTLTGSEVQQILGRWSSDAFLDYTRPQVLEWTDNMSRNMIRHDSFLHATDTHRADDQDDPRVRSRRFNADSFISSPRLPPPSLKNEAKETLSYYSIVQEPNFGSRCLTFCQDLFSATAKHLNVSLAINFTIILLYA